MKCFFNTGVRIASSYLGTTRLQTLYVIIKHDLIRISKPLRFSRLEQRRVEVNEKRGDGAELADKLALADQRRREMEVGFLFAFFQGNII